MLALEIPKIATQMALKTKCFALQFYFKMAYRRLKTNYQNSSPRLQFYRYSTKQCNFQEYKCPKLCIDGFNYCIRHILKDDNAPFRQCAYIYPYSSKFCPLAAPKTDGYAESFCPDHSYKMVHGLGGKPQPPLTAEKLITKLDHLLKPTVVNEESSAEITLPLDPFKEIDSNVVNSSISGVLDYCSESDSDVETAIIDRTLQCKDEDSSDAESVDSTNEDPFKFTSVLSTEEILKYTMEKSERLRNLYLGQFKYISHALREYRRDYVSSLQSEKESVGPICEQTASSAKDINLAEKIRFFNTHHKAYGVDAVLRKKQKDKKKGLSLDGHSRPGVVKCIFTEGGVKCNVRTVPNTKYCPKHILNDHSQVLFRPCGFTAEGHTCQEPLRGIDACFYHMEMVPAQINYNTTLSSEDEETIKEESMKQEVSLTTPPPSQTDSNFEAAKIEDIKMENGILNIMDIDYADAFGFEEEIVVCDGPNENIEPT